MAGIFDFDKTLLAALDARQKRQMYEQDRADRNAQWKQSYDMQLKDYKLRVQQVQNTLEEARRSREFQAEQNELQRAFTRGENNFQYQQNLLPWDEKYGDIGRTGRDIETDLNRDIWEGDQPEPEGRRYITQQQFSNWLGNKQVDLEERYKTGMLRINEALAGLNQPDNYGDEVLDVWQKTSGLLPFQESDYKDIIYDIENYRSSVGGNIPTGGWDLSDFKEMSGKGRIEELRMQKKGKEEATKYGKEMIDKKFKEAEELASFISKTGVGTNKIDKKGAVLFDASIQNYIQHYLQNSSVAEVDKEGNIANDEEVSMGLLSRLAQYGVNQGYYTQSEMTRRLNQVKKSIENAVIGSQGMTAVEQLTKSKQYLEKLYNK